MSLACLWSESAIAILPMAPPESYVAFAESITLPDGRGKHGPYVPATHPAQLAILQAMDGGTYFAPQPYRDIAIAKPVQDGGSLVSVVPLLRRVIRQRQAALIAFPSLDSAKDVWTTKVHPILQAYGGQEPESGGGSKGGAARVITLPNGGRFFLRAAGGRGESQQASVTGDALCIDEVDDWPDLHRIELITKRLEEAGDPLLILVCTVKRQLPERSLILSAVAEGTASRLHYACPDCAAYQPMEWEAVKYKPDGPACVGGTAQIVCQSCGSHWNEDGRRAALARWLVVHRGQTVVDGQVVGPIPDTARFSLTWSRLESPRKTLQSLCASHARAAWFIASQQDHGPMRSFHQDYLTRQYIEPKDTTLPDAISVDLLMARSALAKGWATTPDADREGAERHFSRHLAETPVGAQWCIPSVDVQGDRCYWLLMAGDKEGRTWDQAWGYEHFDRERAEMNRQQLHAVLDRIDGLVGDLRGDLVVPYRGVDANFKTDDVLSWLESHPAWWPVYGASAKKAARMQRAGRRVKDHPGILYLRRTDGWRLKQDRCHIDTNPVRLLAQRAFLLPWGQPGAAHLPAGLTRSPSDLNYLQHLCGELWDERTMTWVKPKGGGRHDYLDCRTYCTALNKLHLLTVNKTPPTTTAPDVAPQAPGWVGQYTSGGSWIQG